MKEDFVLFIIAKKKLNIRWPRYFIKFYNSGKNNKTSITIHTHCVSHLHIFQLQSETYRESTYRTKSIAVKAVPMVISFHPNVTMWNFHILLFVSNGSKQNWKKWLVKKILKTNKQTTPKKPKNQNIKKNPQTQQCFVKKIHIFLGLEFDLAYNSASAYKLPPLKSFRLQECYSSQNTQKFCMSWLHCQGLFTTLSCPKSQHKKGRRDFSAKCNKQIINSTSVVKKFWTIRFYLR